MEAWIKRRHGVGETPGGAVPKLKLTGDGKDFWDAESKKHQARLRELEYRQRKGELIEVASAERFFMQRIDIVKQGFLAFERSLPPRLILCKNEREMAEVLHESIRGLLEVYAAPLPDSLTNEAKIPEAIEDGTEAAND